MISEKWKGGWAQRKKKKRRGWTRRRNTSCSCSHPRYGLWGCSQISGTPQPRRRQAQSPGHRVTQRASQGGRQQGQAPQGGSGFWLWVPSSLGLQDDIQFNTTQSRGSGRPRTVCDHSGGSLSSPGRPVRGPQCGGDCRHPEVSTAKETYWAETTGSHQRIQNSGSIQKCQP